MKVWQNTMKRFSIYDLILIAVMAALGIATKPIIVPLAHLISGPLFIPGGALAGGFYMLWLVIGFGLTGKYGTATFIGFIQALMIMGTGIIGSHGIMSLISYTFPGIATDVVLYLIGHRVCCLPCSFLAGIIANLGGTISVNLIFFRLPWIPLILSLCAAALSGGLGGILAWQILKLLSKYKIGKSIDCLESYNLTEDKGDIEN